MSIAQHGEIIIIINLSPWSQNLSPRVRVQRVKSPQSPLQLLQLTYYRIYRLLVLLCLCLTSILLHKMQFGISLMYAISLIKK